MTTPVPPASPPSPAAQAPAREPSGFPYQAAKFSLYAPLVALVLGCVLNAALKDPQDVATAQTAPAVRMALAGINLLLIASGFIMGIVALAAIPRLGPRGLLGRSITGMAISGLLLTAFGYLLFAVPLTERMAKRIEGEWRSTVTTPEVGTSHVEMALRPDGTARFQLVDGPAPLDLSGHWRVLRQRGAVPLLLQITLDKLLKTTPEVNHLTWELQHVEDLRLELKTRDASGAEVVEVYTRH